MTGTRSLTGVQSRCCTLCVGQPRLKQPWIPRGPEQRDCSPLTGSQCLVENNLFSGSISCGVVVMPPQILTCPAGHSWEHNADGELPANLSEICPFCTLARQ